MRKCERVSIRITAGVSMGSHTDNASTQSSDQWRWLFLVAIAVLLVCSGIAILQYTRFADAASRVEHTHGVLSSIDAIVRRLVDAETAYRGYLLTQDRAFLEPYTGVDTDTRKVFEALGQLVADNPGQAARTARLKELSEQKLNEMAAVVALANGGNLAGAIARLSNGDGKRIMDAVRAAASELRNTESSLLVQRESQARLARQAATGFAVVSLVVAAALAILAVSVRQSFERRHKALLEQMAARQHAERQASAASADLRRSETFNQNILEHSGDCIQVLEPDGRVVLTNRAGVTLMEAEDANSLQSEGWLAQWHADEAVARQAITDAMEKGEGRFHAFRPTAKGTAKWWDVIVTPIRSDAGELRQLVAVSRDVTEQKRAEQERAQLLASERAARSEAERAARMKDEFVNTLSHELRTPLNAILGWIGILRQQQSPEMLAKAIDVIDRNSRRQSQMVDDLLDMSRIMSGKLRLDVQRLDLTSVIEEAIASAQPAADAKGIRLVKTLGSAAVVQGDPGRMQQIVWNLVSNAIKFTPRGGLVQVTLKKVNSHVHIQVSDSGQGIPPEMIPHIFQRFRQGDSSATRRHGGLGLGLAIVRNLVEMHGGTVDAVSEGEGMGSLFTVRLPLALTNNAVEQLNEHHEMPLTTFANLLEDLHVLVLDDEDDAREVVQRLLEDAGARVRTAGNAAEAMEILASRFRPDIILSDIGMPGQDGYEFMQRVRRMGGRIAEVPAAALTALARLEDRKRALMAGYQTHLAKPVDPAELVAMVASLAGRTGRTVA
jgi:PAS domain S-box-containing protein